MGDPGEEGLSYKGADRIKSLTKISGRIYSLENEGKRRCVRIYSESADCDQSIEKKWRGDARVVEKRLRSLSDDFENVVCAIEESKKRLRRNERISRAHFTGSTRREKEKEGARGEGLQAKATLKEEKPSFSNLRRGRGRGDRRGQGRGSFRGRGRDKRYNYRSHIEGGEHS